MQVCSPELGTYCCKRDYDCCTNSTLVHALGKPEIVTIIPNHTAHPTHPPASAATHTSNPKDDGRQSTAYARDTIIGVGAGLAAAMAILIIGCCFWLTKRRPSERYRDRDRKTDVFEMDTLDDSRLAIHKEISVSVSQLDTPAPQTEIDDPTPLELDTRRATIINQVVEMFELDASPSDDGRRPDGTAVQGRSREGPIWEESPSPERRGPDIPILEASPVLAPVHSRLHLRGSNSRISAIQMAATASRPVSEYTPVAGRVPTPLPDILELESSKDMPPIPASPAAIALPEILTSRKFSVERPSTARSHAVSRNMETTPPQGSQSEAEASTRPGPSGSSKGSPVVQKQTLDASGKPETTPPQHLEIEPSMKPGPGGSSLESSASQTHKPETDIPEPSSSMEQATQKEAAETKESQVSDSALGVPSPERVAPQIPLPEQPAPERPAPSNPAVEKAVPKSASRPD